MLPFKPFDRAVTFQTVAIVGKYMAAGIEQSLSDIAGFLAQSGHKVVLEADRPAATATGVTSATFNDGALTLLVGSGHYEFTAPRSP